MIVQTKARLLIAVKSTFHAALLSCLSAAAFFQCSSLPSKDVSSQDEPDTALRIAPGKPDLVFLKRIKTEQQPKQICFHPGRREAYVTNLGGNASPSQGPGSLLIYNSDTWEIIHREKARAAVECSIDEKNQNQLYYSDMFSDEVVKFDLQTRTKIFTAPVKEPGIPNYPGYHHRYMPKIIVQDHAKNRIFVSMWLNGISIIDSTTGRLIQRIPKFCQHPRGMLLQKNELHVMCYGIPHGPGEIVILDADTTEVKRRFRTGGSPRHIVRFDENIALISNLNSGMIYLYDLNRGEILQTLKAGAANTIVLDPGKEYLYVNDRSRNLINLISIREWKIVDVIKTGKYPTGLDVSDDGQYLAVTNFHDSSFDLFKIDRLGSNKAANGN